jgi:hypothetical protein
MAGQDEFQIELGITEAGAAGQRGAAAAGGGRVFGGVVGGGVSRGERRAGRFIENRLFEDPAKGIARYAIGEAMASGLHTLLPNADGNTFTEVGKIAGDIGMRSLFLKSLKGGAIIGGITAAISLIQQSLELVTKRAEELRSEFAKFKKDFEESKARTAALLKEDTKVTRQEIEDIRRNLYNRDLAAF